MIFLQQVLAEVEKSVEEKKKHGRRMVIEEVEEISDEDVSGVSKHDASKDTSNV